MLLKLNISMSRTESQSPLPGLISGTLNHDPLRGYEGRTTMGFHTGFHFGLFVRDGAEREEDCNYIHSLHPLS